MRVAVYYNNKDIRVEERPVPRIGPGELLVKIWASGICGSDVMEWYRIKKAPVILGHEIAGEIVETGKGVDRYGIGERVFVSHHVPCNTCRFCLNGHHTACDTLHTTNFDPGGFCEYVRVPQINVDRGVFVIPNEVSYEESTFIEPLACVYRGQRLSGLKPGDSVLVLGAGISGLLHIALAKALGAGTIFATDVSEYRLEMARRFGADVGILATEDVSERIRKENGGFAADQVLLCTGATSALHQAFSSVERGGTVLLFAPTEPGFCMPLDLNDVWKKGVTIKPSYGAGPLDISVSMELLRRKRVPVEEMITHRLGLEDAGKGFSLVAEADRSVKVIIEPQR